MRFTDRLVLDGTRVRQDGSLVANARVARTGVQIYGGLEVGKPNMDVVRVYRPADQVFSDATLASFAHRPVTNDHPTRLVDADNWKDVAVGQTSGDVMAEAHCIRVPLMVSDGAAVNDVQSGKRELSAGYTCDLKWEAGTSPSGEAYDAIQTNIRANHIAIVHRGRAGSECRIGDDAQDGGIDRTQWGSSPLTISKKDTAMPELKTVVLGDEAVQVEVADVAKIDAFKADQARALTDMQKKHEEETDERDKELAKKDAEIDDLKSKALDAAAIDKLVADRADLIAKAKSIAPDVATDGLSTSDIRKAVVVAKRGDAVKDKSDAYIDAAFDLLTEDASATDTLQDAVNGSPPKQVANDAQKARTQAMADKANAWKRPSEKGAA